MLRQGNTGKGERLPRSLEPHTAAESSRKCSSILAYLDEIAENLTTADPSSSGAQPRRADPACSTERSYSGGGRPPSLGSGRQRQRPSAPQQGHRHQQQDHTSRYERETNGTQDHDLAPLSFSRAAAGIHHRAPWDGSLKKINTAMGNNDQDKARQVVSTTRPPPPPANSNSANRKNPYDRGKSFIGNNPGALPVRLNVVDHGSGNSSSSKHNGAGGDVCRRDYPHDRDSITPMIPDVASTTTTQENPSAKSRRRWVWDEWDEWDVGDSAAAQEDSRRGGKGGRKEEESGGDSKPITNGEEKNPTVMNSPRVKENPISSSRVMGDNNSETRSATHPSGGSIAVAVVGMHDGNNGSTDDFDDHGALARRSREWVAVQQQQHHHHQGGEAYNDFCYTTPAAKQAFEEVQATARNMKEDLKQRRSEVRRVMLKAMGDTVVMQRHSKYNSDGQP